MNLDLDFYRAMLLRRFPVMSPICSAVLRIGGRHRPAAAKCLFYLCAAFG